MHFVDILRCADKSLYIGESLACPRCGGRMRLVALITQSATIQRILRHVGLWAELPTPRPPPQRRAPARDTLT